MRWVGASSKRDYSPGDFKRFERGSIFLLIVLYSIHADLDNSINHYGENVLSPSVNLLTVSSLLPSPSYKL